MEPQDFLPLTPVAFEILLSLGEGHQHGYAIMQAVNRSAAGRAVHPGTLYRAIARLVEESLLEELDGKGSGRRRIYALTQLGRDVAAAESARLADQLDRAAAVLALKRPSRA